MTRLSWVNRGLLTVLSIATGAVELAQMEEEMALFRAVGFTDGLTIAFGAVQLAGGLLLVPNRTTRIGAWVMAPTFAFATYALFANGRVVFAVVSLLFIAMAILHGARGSDAAHAPPARRPDP
jgi:hypothetical protein